MDLTDPGQVAEQYRTEANLQTRRSVWRDSAEGRNPMDAAAEAIRRAEPATILEIGCGTGHFAARLAEESPRARVIATDLSKRMVALAASRGVTGLLADAQGLPFGDAELDVVAAMWMLYHVPDLDAALAEVRRVLRPGGLLVAVTNGDEHLAGLWRDAGAEPPVSRFSSENGEDALRRHFDDVRREDIATRAVFDDHATAAAYLGTVDATLGAALAHFDGPRTYTGATTVFRAVTPTS